MLLKLLSTFLYTAQAGKEIEPIKGSSHMYLAKYKKRRIPLCKGADRVRNSPSTKTCLNEFVIFLYTAQAGKQV
jgi:hypothetical protein